MRRLMTGYAINFNLRGGKACGWPPLGFPAAAVARFLGVTTSAVVRAARTG